MNGGIATEAIDGIPVREVDFAGRFLLSASGIKQNKGKNQAKERETLHGGIWDGESFLGVEC